MLTPQQYLDKYSGQSLLYNTKDPSLRGQCVQAVCFFVQENGFPVIWADAYYWFTNKVGQYDYIANTATAVPQVGDIIVWGPGTPGSGGAGHIAVCLTPRPGTGTFVSVDQNWGGKTVHAVTHDYSNVVGWLRLRGVNFNPAPAPAALAAQTQGDEMIANADQATKIYKMLRPNGTPSADEINSTAGRRSFAQFVNDAQNEVNQRDANLRTQQQQLADMSNTINAQNATITDLNNKLTDTSTSNAQKQQALDEALANLAQTNAQLTTTHDQLKDLQDSMPTATPAPANSVDSDASRFTKLLAWLLDKIKR